MHIRHSFGVAVGSALALLAGGYAGCGSSSTNSSPGGDGTPLDATADGTSSADATGGDSSADDASERDATLAAGDAGDAASADATSDSANGDGDATSADAGDGADAGDASPKFGPTTVTLTMDAFSVPSLAEVYKCQLIGNPFGHDVDVVRFDGYVTPGVLPFKVFSLPAAEAASYSRVLQDCSGDLEKHSFAYTSQQPGHWIENFPAADLGYPVPAGNFILLYAHAFNPSSQPIETTVKITLFTAASGVVTTHVGRLLLDNTSFSVPPPDAGAPVDVVSKSINVPAGTTYHIFQSQSQMHMYGQYESAYLDGTQFFNETNWNQPKAVTHNPTIDATAGHALSWECGYTNPSGTPMVFGPGLQTQDVCAYFGWYYPAPADAPDVAFTP